MAPREKPFQNVYADALANIGCGHALWFPEGPDGSAEVQIGDVGYINELGAFIFLFSIDKKYEGDPERGMENRLPPDDCHYFEFADWKRHDFRHFAQPQSKYFSRTVKWNETGVDFTGGVDMANASARLSCTIEAEEGAMCLMPTGAIANSEDNNRLLQSHIKHNIERWYEVLSKELTIKLEELIVIRGTIKAMQFQIMALRGSSKSKGLDISMRAIELGGVGLHVTVHAKSDAQHLTRSIPNDHDIYSDDPLDSEASRTSKKPSSMFLFFYRMKRQFILWKKIEANAGPHVLPPREGPTGGPSAMVAVDEDGDEVSTPTSNGPIDVLLYYILEACPDARCAFACEEDLYSLYLGEELPDDILASLRERKPRVVVDEHKIGTMVLEDVIRRERVYGYTGRALGTTLEQKDETAGIPFRDAEIAFRNSAGREEKLDWPHQHLSDKAQQSLFNAAAISPDRKLVAVGCDDATIILWDLTVGKVISRPKGHEESVYTLDFSPDGKRLASGSADKKVIVWTVSVGDSRSMTDKTYTLDGHELDVTKVVYSPDGSLLLSGSMDSTFKIWDASHGYELIRSINNIIWHHLLSFTPDSKKLVTTISNLIFVRDLTVAPETGAAEAEQLGIVTMRGHDANIDMITISHKGDRVATASQDETARVWNAESGEALVLLHEHTAAVWCIAFSPDDEYIATGSDDMKIVVANSWDGKLHYIFADHPGVVSTICYSGSGKFICAGTSEGKIKLLNAGTGEFIAEYEGHSDKIRTSTFSTDEKSIISLSEDGDICTFRFPKSGTLFLELWLDEHVTSCEHGSTSRGEISSYGFSAVAF